MSPVLIGVIVFVVIIIVYFVFFNSSEEPPPVVIVEEVVEDDGDTAYVNEVADIVRDFSKNAGRGARLTIYELDGDEEAELIMLKKARDGIQLDLLVDDGDADFSDAVMGLMNEWEYEDADGEMETDAGEYMTFYTDETHAELGELCEELLNHIYKYDPREEVGVEAEGYDL
ncbi:MAG: hypothetical protein H6728_08620 [Myxococcales bacterium]|nr:hypothetical protein [Myxococcales bacterium]MCB9643124.1 hypothetical protein [Myxococcales bacterium]